MLSKEIRRKFIEYFKKNGHQHVSSSSVIPHDDPSLLFINAGMNQFKDVFLGVSRRDFSRAVTVQKCIRVGGKHNDLDNVGHTTRHMTFFEMLGNFSFGDYFKHEAIRYAFTVTTEILQFPVEKLWISIFETDDESFEIWKNFVDESRIVRMGKEENFWQMGDIGPCGPCSELLLDRGSNYGDAKTPLQDSSGERFLEFWNLVFMESNLSADGHLKPLPKQSIDTGLGLERLVALKMGVNSVFETDIMQGLIRKIEEICSIKYRKNDPHFAPAFHVIADHIRSLAFAISDGAVPSNIDRGYVLRKILRRAMRYAKNLSIHEPFLAKLIPTLIELMGEEYPELPAAQTHIESLLHKEEENFIRTLQRGGNILQTVIKKAQKSPHKQITGEDAFKLKDTYGFPIEEVLLIAKDLDLAVNLESYQLLEEKAKERSRQATAFKSAKLQENLYQEFANKSPAPEFVGYERDHADAAVVGIIVEGEFVERLQSESEGIILLDRTPFYAEKGGQVGDQGRIHHSKASFAVQDTQEPFPGVIAHVGIIKKGALHIGDPVRAEVDQLRRREIERAHTATHLLDHSLLHILGTHVKQSGSLVEANRLRFDFTHHQALSGEQLRSIEMHINENIRNCASVTGYTLTYDEAQKRSDIIQEFGEKYGEKVRVIDIGGFSKELCGGTHVNNIGVIGLFRIIKESSVGAGIRRIEAVVAKEAENFMYREEEILEEACQQLHTQKAKLISRIQSVQEEIGALKQEMKAIREEHLHNISLSLRAKIEKANEEVCFLTACTDVNKDELISLSNALLNFMPSGAVFLANKKNASLQLLIRVSDDLIEKNVSAKELMQEVAPLLHGKGGGNKQLAQAGASDGTKIIEAFAIFKQRIQTLC